MKILIHLQKLTNDLLFQCYFYFNSMSRMGSVYATTATIIPSSKSLNDLIKYLHSNCVLIHAILRNLIRFNEKNARRLSDIYYQLFTAIIRCRLATDGLINSSCMSPTFIHSLKHSLLQNGKFIVDNGGVLHSNSSFSVYLTSFITVFNLIQSQIKET